jgi:glycosyltransferase involved in cell wall biosynthesis
MSNNSSPFFAVVIPAYNEASTIADIARRTCQFTSFVIVVNDGSTDNTAQALESLPVTIINNPNNIGKGKSILSGAKYAIEQGAKSVITLDGDGQHQPNDIPLLLEKAAANPSTIIIAARTRDRHLAPPLRRFANGFADFWISWAAGQRIRDSQSGFRLYPSAVFQNCDTNSDKFVFESEILIDAAHKGIFSKGITIDTVYLKNTRASHYRPAADTWAIVKMVASKLCVRGFYPLGLLRSLGILPHTRKSVIKVI